jgi:hypothetical protein
VLPPGIIAQGASGQFGGMGGMGGGMGGGGMMGGGMGMGGGVMPASMGMMMLSRLIMYLCGDFDTWDQRAMAMGGMGMGGMGGMGGGMGGMGGMMGGMGGGMRSVPPTGLPFASLRPGQRRDLPTRLVSLSAPDPQSESGLNLPAKGEKLQLGDISQLGADARTQKALKRLQADKAPESVCQLVMWNLGQGMDWAQVAELSTKWANPHELTLARQFVESLDSLGDDESGTVHFEVEAADPAAKSDADSLRKQLSEGLFLGLKPVQGIAAQPEGPAVACRIRLSGKEALVQVLSSDGSARRWLPFGKFSLAAEHKGQQLEAAKLADAVAENVLSRLVRAQLRRGPTVKGKPTYQVRIDNASPLVLNGLAVLGSEPKPAEAAKELLGISVSPRRSMTVPATEDVVKALGLRKGIRIVAANLSGL